MSVLEIEKAVEQLSASDLATFGEWFARHQSAVWDAQIEGDSKAGKLDGLIAAAREQNRLGKSRPLSVDFPVSTDPNR